MASKQKLQEVAEEAYRILLRGVWAVERGGKYTVAEAEEEVKMLANKNGFRFEEVEKEAQRISLQK
jgi:hypothetical protein